MKSTASKPTILVTDAGRGSAISIVRSLGRRGWRVIAADVRPGSAGFRSRYVAAPVVYPSPETSPGPFVAALEQAVGRHDVDLIIPVTDAAILPLVAVRERFEPHCRLAVAARDSLECVLDKSKTMDIASRLGVPIPRTRLVSTAAEALCAAPQLGWPVVLKPQVSRLQVTGGPLQKLAVVYAHDDKSLMRQMRNFESRCPVLLQEYCAGTGCGVELLLHEGRPLAAFQHRRLREMPIHGGPSALRESVALDPDLYRHSLAILSELKWTGLAMVEFKLGPQGGKLMEINGRIWGSLPLAVHAGMDFPARLVELLLDGPSATADCDTNYRVGVRAHNLELELKWIIATACGMRRVPLLHTPRRRDSLPALLQLLHPAYKHDILSLHDPLPGLADVLRIARRGAGSFLPSV